MDLGSSSFHRRLLSSSSAPLVPSFSPSISPTASSPSVSRSPLPEKILFFGVKKELAVQVPSALEGIRVEVSIKENVQEFCRKIIRKYAPESIRKDGNKSFSDVKEQLKIPKKMFLMTELVLGLADEDENISKMILEIDINICDEMKILHTDGDGTTENVKIEYFKRIKFYLNRPLSGLWTLSSILTDNNSTFTNLPSNTGVVSTGGGISKLKIIRNHSVNFVDIFHGKYHSQSIEGVGYGVTIKKENSKKLNVNVRDKTKSWELSFVRDESVQLSKMYGKILKSARKVKSYDEEFSLNNRVEKKVVRNQRNVVLNTGESYKDNKEAHSPSALSEEEEGEDGLFLSLLIDVKLLSCPEGVSTSGIGIGGKEGLLGSTKTLKNTLSAVDAADEKEKSKSACDVSITDFSLFRSNNDPSGFVKMRSDVLPLRNPTVIPKSVLPTDFKNTENDVKPSRVLETVQTVEYPSVLISSEIPSSQFSVLGGGIEFKLTVRPGRNLDPQIPAKSKERRYALNKNNKNVRNEAYETEEQHEGLKWVRGMMISSFTLTMRSGGLPGYAKVRTYHAGTTHTTQDSFL